jgi:AraC-like DNA-binding protein
VKLEYTPTSSRNRARPFSTAVVLAKASLTQGAAVTKDAPISQSATITSRALVALEPYLRARGLDARHLSARAGIQWAAAADPDGVVALDAYVHLLELAAKAADDDAFGLEYGAQFPAGPMGIYHYCVVSAATVRDALQQSIRFLQLATSGHTAELTECGHVSYYTWSYMAPIENLAQHSDSITALLVNRIRLMTDPAWLPHSTEFAHARPRAHAAFTTFLGPNVTFGAPSTRIAIDTATLDRTSAVHDPYLIKEMSRVAAKIIAPKAQGSNIVDRVADQIIRALPKGEAREPLVAAVLATSVRDLQRELEAAGTTFTGLLEDVRMETAKRLLEQSDLQLTEIAYLLDFSELSAFSRAAKQWFGTSPSTYRQQARATARLPKD